MPLKLEFVLDEISKKQKVIRKCEEFKVKWNNWIGFEDTMEYGIFDNGMISGLKSRLTKVKRNQLLNRTVSLITELKKLRELEKLERSTLELENKIDQICNNWERSFSSYETYESYKDFLSFNENMKSCENFLIFLELYYKKLKKI